MKKTKQKSATYWIKKANEQGFLLNNLFQLDDYSYQAEFRAKDNRSFTIFAYGSTMSEALRRAIKQQGSALPPKRRRRRLPRSMTR